MQEPASEPAIQWDLRKARSNVRKHRVSFEEASTVFDDMLSTTKPDPDHSINENRFITVGLSSSNPVLLVAHTEDPEGIRIISARLTTRSERDAYEND
jgi:uncharacterized DUF497 family protein